MSRFDHRLGEVGEADPADQVEVRAQRPLDQVEAGGAEHQVVAEQLAAPALHQDRDQALLETDVEAAGAAAVDARIDVCPARTAP